MEGWRDEAIRRERMIMRRKDVDASCKSGLVKILFKRQFRIRSREHRHELEDKLLENT